MPFKVEQKRHEAWETECKKAVIDGMVELANVKEGWRVLKGWALVDMSANCSDIKSRDRLQDKLATKSGMPQVARKYSNALFYDFKRHSCIIQVSKLAMQELIIPNLGMVFGQYSTMSNKAPRRINWM